MRCEQSEGSTHGAAQWWSVRAQSGRARAAVDVRACAAKPRHAVCGVGVAWSGVKCGGVEWRG